MDRWLYGSSASLKSNIYIAKRVHRHSSPFQKEVRTDSWLFSTTDEDKSVRLYVRVSWKYVTFKFISTKMFTYYLLQTHLCLLDGLSVRTIYDKVIMEMVELFNKKVLRDLALRLG